MKNFHRRMLQPTNRVNFIYIIYCDQKICPIQKIQILHLHLQMPDGMCTTNYSHPPVILEESTLTCFLSGQLSVAKRTIRRRSRDFCRDLVVFPRLSITSDLTLIYEFLWSGRTNQKLLTKTGRKNGMLEMGTDFMIELATKFIFLFKLKHFLETFFVQFISYTLNIVT